MKKLDRKKLSLSQATIRALTDDGLHAVAGGGNLTVCSNMDSTCSHVALSNFTACNCDLNNN